MYLLQSGYRLLQFLNTAKRGRAWRASEEASTRSLSLPPVRADIRGAACGVLVSLSVRRLVVAVSCPSLQSEQDSRAATKQSRAGPGGRVHVRRPATHREVASQRPDLLLLLLLFLPPVVRAAQR